MATLSTLPALVVPNRKAQFQFELDESATNFVRVWVTNAPPGSELREKLDKARANRIEVFISESPTDHTWETQFDRGGRYTFAAQEYIRGATGSAGYQGAPGAAPLETKVGSEYTITLDIGQRLTSPVGTGEDRATLVLWLWGNDIEETTVEHHGERSPDIIAESPSPHMKAAMDATAVRSAVAALGGISATTALGDVDAIVSDIVTQHNAHINIAIVLHYTADTANALPVQYASTMAPKDLPVFVNLALQYQRRHRINDDGSGEYGAGEYHNPTGAAFKADFANVPIIDTVSGLPDAYAALAEIWRCHEGHRPFPNEWHGTPTGPVSSFALATLPLLLQVHLRVFEVLSSFSSTAVPTQVPGAQLLIEGAGFVEG